MSRIRVIELKVKKETLHSVKKKNEPDSPDTPCENDDVGKDQVAELLAKLPKLGKTFHIHRKIGEGTFSSVYLGTLRSESGRPRLARSLYAIKHLVPTTASRVAHELRCLREIGGKNHVMGVDYYLRHQDTVVFVMPYIQHKKFSEYVRDMDAAELRDYMRALFTALRHVHSFDVIHRDVKPSNFLYDRENRRYALVDFGLAQHTQQPPAEPAQPPPAHQTLKRARDDDGLLPGAKRMALDLTTRALPSPPPKPTVLQPNVNARDRERIDVAQAQACGSRAPCACAGVGGVCGECAAWAPPRANRAGTQGFRPPEVLFKYPAQGTAVDMWACGVVLASALSGRYPFFRAADDVTALAEIMALLGTQPLHATAAALGCRLVTSTPRRGNCLRKLTAHLRGACVAPFAAHATHATRSSHCAECRLPPPHCVCLDPARPPHSIDPDRSYAGFPDAAFALAARLLEPDPRRRITAADALRHPFLQP